MKTRRETVTMKDGRVYRLQSYASVTIDPDTLQLHLTSFDSTYRASMSAQDLLFMYNTAVECLYFSRFRLAEAEREAEYWHRTSDERIGNDSD